MPRSVLQSIPTVSVSPVDHEGTHSIKEGFDVGWFLAQSNRNRTVETKRFDDWFDLARKAAVDAHAEAERGEKSGKEYVGVHFTWENDEASYVLMETS